MGVELLNLLGVFTHFIALLMGLKSVKRYSYIWVNRQWGDVDLDYIVLSLSICMNVLIISLLTFYTLQASTGLGFKVEILFALYHGLTGLVVSYWHWSIREKYDPRLDILGLKGC